MAPSLYKIVLTIVIIIILLTQLKRLFSHFAPVEIREISFNIKRLNRTLAPLCQRRELLKLMVVVRNLSY